MKKILSLALILALSLSATACNKDNANLSDSAEVSGKAQGSGIELILPSDSTVITVEYQAYQGHDGVDFGGQEGDSVYATAKGKVVQIKNSDANYGNFVVLEHENGYETKYAHCSELLVKMDDEVAVGQEIATFGMTEMAVSANLHFEVWHDGNILDPLDYIKLD